MTTVEPRPGSDARSRTIESRERAWALAWATVVVVAVVLAIAAALVGIWLVRETIVWLVAAGFLAFSIEPLVRMSQRRGMGRGAATTVAFTIIALVVLVFPWFAIPPSLTGRATFATTSPPTSSSSRTRRRRTP